MRFSDVVADKGIKDRLVEMADNGMLGHALMLHEDEGGGALALAIALSQYLLCPGRHDGDSCGSCNTCSRTSRLIYPDIHFAFPVNSGSRQGGDRKPTSDTYLAEWRSLYASNLRRYLAGLTGGILCQYIFQYGAVVALILKKFQKLRPVFLRRKHKHSDIQPLRFDFFGESLL